MEGEYTISVRPGKLEHHYKIEGSPEEHLNVLNNAIHAVLEDFDRVFERIIGNRLDRAEFLLVSADFLSTVASNYVVVRDGTGEAKDFMKNLLKKANGEG